MPTKRKSSLASNPSIYDHVDSDHLFSGFGRSANNAQNAVEAAQDRLREEAPLERRRPVALGLGDGDGAAVASPSRVEEEGTAATIENERSERLNPSSTPRSNRNHRQLSISPSPHPPTRDLQTDEEANRPSPNSTQTSDRGKVVSWSSLPRKGQLTILTLARLAEPLTQTSLQSYLYYQLASFDPSQAPSQITSQAGVVIAAFAAAQAVTALFWGTVADSQWGGRKLVIIVGLCGTGLGNLGYGFSGSWQTAVAFRALAGSLNGNVGVMRTMISEIVKEKKYQSRAFLLLPMCFNVGVIIGPLMGGLLADPIGSYPELFGPGTVLGGDDGIWWMQQWPFALPNMVSAVYLFSAGLMVWLGLEETHEILQDRPDTGIRIGRTLKRWVQQVTRRRSHGYTAVPSHEATIDGEIPEGEEGASSVPTTPATPLTPLRSRIHSPPTRQKLPFRRLWTQNVIWTLASHFLLAMCVGTFNALWFLFLSTPRYDPAHPRPSWLTAPSLPIHFTGGLGLSPPKIGAAMAVLGFIGISLQLLVYPSVAARLGTLRAFQSAAILFPIVYVCTPFLALVPSTGPKPPAAADGVAVWLAIAAVLAVQVLARTFALPATAILINNSSPHPSVLGTVHGVAQSASSAARTLGPIGAGWAFGRGLEMGVVGLAFWIMAAVGVVEVFVSCMLREGDGHEIWLPGEKDGLEHEHEPTEEREEHEGIEEHSEDDRERRHAQSGRS